MIDKKETVELDENFIVFTIPSATVEVTISAKVWHNGRVINVERTVGFDEIREAFKEAEEGYIPSDATFVLNPNASKSKVEQLVQRYMDKLEGGIED